jgi:hypothetical protein
MSDKQVRIWNEVAVVYFYGLHTNSPGDYEENHEKENQLFKKQVREL